MRMYAALVYSYHGTVLETANSIQWRIRGGGGGGGGKGARAPLPPPFRSSNYKLIVAQYSVLNFILNAKASALRPSRKGVYPPSRTHPLSVNHAHFSLNSNFSLLVPPLSKFLDAPLEYLLWCVRACAYMCVCACVHVRVCT